VRTSLPVAVRLTKRTHLVVLMAVVSATLVCAMLGQIARPWSTSAASTESAFLPAQQVKGAGEARWASLGPPGPAAVNAIIAAPQWPTDPTMLVIRTAEGAAGQSGAREIFRTLDGGDSWERLTSPLLTGPNSPSALSFGPGPSGRRIFATSGSAIRFSDDRGSTWRTAREPGGSLVFSPAYTRDQTIFVRRSYDLARSDDAGDTWVDLPQLPAVRIRSLVVSPMVGQSRHLFVLHGEATPPDDVDELGLLVSHDGGQSWRPIPAMEIEGVRFGAMTSLPISESYAEDTTLLAVVNAYGRPNQCFRRGVNRPTEPSYRAAAVRSNDGGDSWHVVADLGEGCSTRIEMGISSDFARDGIALLLRSATHQSPASSNCRIRRTEDHGDSWQGVNRGAQYESCRALRVSGSGGTLVAHYHLTRYPNQNSWERSEDSGRTFRGLAPPLQEPITEPGPLETRGPMSLVGTRRLGVWEYGPGARTARAILPCARDPVGGFGRAYQEPNVRVYLGCPIEDEHPVRVRVQPMAQESDPNRTGYWTEDENPDWFDVRAPGWVDVKRKNTEDTFRGWPDGEVTIVDGVTQRFAGGTMIWLPRPDGSHSILVLARIRYFEFPD
jgi:photosystem II stability/assembly factor-like uncharacterized protein